MFDPQQALLDLLQPGGVNQTLFPPTSRYYGIPTATLVGPNGVFEIYLKRRFLPPLPKGPLEHHNVTQGERLDYIAFRSLGDAEVFWRIADVNAEMEASRLTAKAGRIIRIPIEGPQQ